jgi:hypothetical protein
MYQHDTPASEPGEAEETPLPATLTFVLTMGVTFVVLWFGIFVLLKERW